MKKIITTVAVAALSLGGLAACGSDDDNDVPGVTTPVNDTTLDTTMDTTMTTTMDTSMNVPADTNMTGGVGSTVDTTTP